jgi:site-specific recombinase XerD
MRQALDVIAAVLASGADAMTLPWSRITYAHVAAVRARLGAAYAATTANKMLAAMKGVLRQAFALGFMGAETFTRCLTVKSIRGSQAQRGRALSQEELRTMFRVCDKATAGGARDAALLALAYSAGLRRSEIVSIDLDDYNEQAGTILIHGKGAKERLVYVTSGAHTGHRDHPFRRIAIARFAASRSRVSAHRDRSEATSLLESGLVVGVPRVGGRRLGSLASAFNPS